VVGGDGSGFTAPWRDGGRWERAGWLVIVVGVGRRGGGCVCLEAAQSLAVALGEAPVAMALVRAAELVVAGRIVACRGAIAHFCQFCLGEHL
jgi:hypothetical protein